MRVGPFTLRPPQIRAIESTRAAMAECFTEGNRPRVILQAVCGFGKTVCSSFIMQEAALKGKKVAFIVHGRQLVFQKSEKLADAEMFHTVVMAQTGGELRAAALPFKDDPGNLMVISKDTYESMLDAGQEPFDVDLWIIDECDNATSDAWWRVLQTRNVPMIGLTATPCRSNGLGLGDRWDKLVPSASHQELIDNGFIVPCKVFDSGRIDTRGVDVNQENGEYIQADIEKRCFTPELVGDFCAEFWRLNPTLRPTAFYASSVAHSIAQAQQFRDGDGTLFAKRLVWEHVDAETPQTERKRIYRGLAEGDINGVCNYAVLRRGFDCPAISCVQLGVAMASTREYLQTVGRGQRPAPGKEDFIVIDHGQNVRRHLWPQLDREWSLDPRKPMKIAPGEGGAATENRTCKECGAVYKASLRICPNCGSKRIREGELVRTHDGTLQEVDPPKVTVKQKRPVSDEQRAFESVYFPASKSNSERPCNFNQLRHIFRKRYPHLQIISGSVTTCGPSGPVEIPTTMVLNRHTNSTHPLGYVPEPYSPLWSLPVRGVPREKLQQPAYGVDG